MTNKQGTTNWKEERRKRAWALHQEGWSQKKIAEALGVTPGAVSQWIKRGEQGGAEKLLHPKASGRPARLKEADRERLKEMLAKGAQHYGFQGAVWTCGRVAQVIVREFGISYHPAHVSRILAEIGWTPQKPRLKAKQQKEQEVNQWWQERWPEVKKRH